jgi:molybdopterin molybdotransferase
MITPAEADQRIAAALPAYPVETVALSEARGHILRADVLADRDLPPYDRVTMDGIAIAYAAWQSGTRQFRIEATAVAGAPAPALAQPEQDCLQVMTGAMLPQGADTVIPFEEVSIEHELATVHADYRPAPLQYLHSAGSDRRKGEPVLSAGVRLRGPHIAVAAAVGQTELRVARRPAVAIISTGDELKQVHETVQPFQIRSANDHGMRASLQASGYQQVDLYTVQDDLDATISLLETVFQTYGVVLLTGGVSAGKRDFVPRALEAVGVQQVFHKVRQKPGKPLWFGVHPDGQPVFGLPGNTVSTLVCLHRYVLPALARALGADEPPVQTMPLADAIRFAPPLTGFIPVQLIAHPAGGYAAKPCMTNTSGDFASLSQTDGFVELPEGETMFPAGQVVRFVAWK